MNASALRRYSRKEITSWHDNGSCKSSGLPEKIRRSSSSVDNVKVSLKSKTPTHKALAESRNSKKRNLHWCLYLVLKFTARSQNPFSCWHEENIFRRHKSYASKCLMPLTTPRDRKQRSHVTQANIIAMRCS